jgi:dTDP-4-dehydrorhamnose 3,5-epimerase
MSLWPSEDQSTTSGTDLMKVIHQAIPDVKLLIPKRFMDERGYFCETYNSRTMNATAIDFEFVQDNQSLSRDAGVLRGLHYQVPPMAQHKLVRVLRGRILDVAVDIRAGSPTYGRHVAIELDAESGGQLFLPMGFAHGFMTMVPNTEVFYKVSDFYSPEHAKGIRWDDPALGIAWPTDVLGDDGCVILSGNDRQLPALDELERSFEYDIGRPKTGEGTK